MALILGCLGAFPVPFGEAPRWWLVAPAALFLVLALLRPPWLAPLNRLWFRLGELLHRIVSPVVMAMIFFLVVTPTGIAMRLCGKDPMRLRAEGDSYWIVRDPPGPKPATMKDQF